jgi:hypothetical protein
VTQLENTVVDRFFLCVPVYQLCAPSVLIKVGHLIGLI